MKILYGVQGTGNGHFSRAIALTPELAKYGEVDILVSGSQHDIKLPFEVNYTYAGVGFQFGQKGGIDITQTIKGQRPIRFIKDVWQLPVDKYDLVISDFEPVTAWACRLRQKPCVALSHQASFLSTKTPRPIRKSVAAETVMRHYAPTSSWYGFHFESYDENIYEPIIRQSIRQLSVSDDGHYVVYLPAFSSQYLLSVFKKIKDVKWKIYVKGRYNVCHHGHITLMPVGHPQWKQDIASCRGVIMGAGFEGPSEMLYLGKKLMVIPMSNQYEQQCNAEALRRLGVTVMSQLAATDIHEIENWLNLSEVLQLPFAFKTDEIVEKVVHHSFPVYQTVPQLVSSK